MKWLCRWGKKSWKQKWIAITLRYGCYMYNTILTIPHYVPTFLKKEFKMLCDTRAGGCNLTGRCTWWKASKELFFILYVRACVEGDATVCCFMIYSVVLFFFYVMVFCFLSAMPSPPSSPPASFTRLSSPWSQRASWLFSSGPPRFVCLFVSLFTPAAPGWSRAAVTPSLDKWQPRRRWARRDAWAQTGEKKNTDRQQKQVDVWLWASEPSNRAGGASVYACVGSGMRRHTRTLKKGAIWSFSIASPQNGGRDITHSSPEYR